MEPTFSNWVTLKDRATETLVVLVSLCVGLTIGIGCTIILFREMSTDVQVFLVTFICIVCLLCGLAEKSWRRAQQECKRFQDAHPDIVLAWQNR